MTASLHPDPLAPLSPLLPTQEPSLTFYHREAIGPTVRIVALGDVGFSGRVAEAAPDGNPLSLLMEVAPFLQEADIVFANLESPLVANPSGSGYFAGLPAGAAALRQAGVTLVSLANNHAYDYGAPGMLETIHYCRTAGLQVLGADEDEPARAKQLLRTDVAGLRIGWLGCGRSQQQQATSGPWYWEYSPEELERRVREERSQVDLLIVSLHLGFMLLDYPHPGHKAMSRRLVKAGADLVLLHHAHVLQGFSVVADGQQRSGIVCYNLGNFLFDGREGYVPTRVAVREQNEGAMFVFDVDEAGVSRAAIIPTVIAEDCSVRWARGAAGDRILRRLERISRETESEYAGKFRRQRLVRNGSHMLRVVIHHTLRGNFAPLQELVGKLRPSRALKDVRKRRRQGRLDEQFLESEQLSSSP